MFFVYLSFLGDANISVWFFFLYKKTFLLCNFRVAVVVFILTFYFQMSKREIVALLHVMARKIPEPDEPRYK